MASRLQRVFLLDSPDIYVHAVEMMIEHDFDPLVDASTPPEQPRFDDAVAVLSAQPVVPLEQIDATLKNRRRWFLAGAFAIAMVLGAASALVASYLKLRNTPVTAEVSEEEELAVEPEPVAVAEPAPVESSAAEEDIQAPEVFVVPAREPKRRSVARSNTDVTRAGTESSEDEEEQLERIREAVLDDEWQERRARRALRRERRRSERYNHRDLSNLDEIFEGRRRRP